MALFQTSVLKSHLALLNEAAVEKAYKKYQKYFWNPTIQENIKSANEEQYQATFLSELFVNIFGYTLFPNPDSNLTTEFKNEKNQRKADAAILKDGVAIGVIELKGTNTKDLESIRRQAFDYKANHKGCVYVVTSNFEKLRFYINDATEFEEFDLFTLTPERFKLLYLCLHIDGILNHTPLKIKEASVRVEEEITKAFYKDYSVFKRELFRDLVRRNAKTVKAKLGEANLLENQEYIVRLEKNVKLTLFQKSQKLIDRFLFIFFAEDRMLLPYNSTLQILNKWKDDWDFGDERPLYDLFRQYFKFLDTGRKGTQRRAEIYAYNGGLFMPDALLDALEIDSDLLYKHTYLLSNYDFESQIDVNILGHIFENSLNEIESVTTEIEGGDFDKQTSKRKKDGVFYTPKYITKYIVENTVGKLCEEKKIELNFHEEEYFRGRKHRNKTTIEKLVHILDEYRDWLLQLTICDPACGSGAFLNQALDFLIKEHSYIDELKTKILGGGLQFPDIETTILENNIYGVDLNEESVEIAKLSLWLRTAQPRRKLNDLSSNIKCGNSLIDDKKVAGDKAFKWENEFPEIFAKGGFDVVIGNPPYVSTKEISNNQKEYLKKEYSTAKGQFDLYGIFIQKSYEILKRKTGFFGFITSNTFIANKDFLTLRKLLLSKTTLHKIINLGETVFDDADLDVAILIFQKIKPKDNSQINIVKNRFDFDINTSTTLFQELFDDKKYNYEFKINCDLSDFKLLRKLYKNSINLGDILHLPRGIEIGGNSHFISSDSSLKPIIYGRSISRYRIDFDDHYIEFQDNKSKFKSIEIYHQPKLLIQRIRNLTLKRRIVAVYDDENYLCTNTLRIGIPKNVEECNLKFILGILNSNCINYLFLKFFLNKDIYAYQLQTIPIIKTNVENERIISTLVSELQRMNKKKFHGLYSFSSYFESIYDLKTISRKLQSWHELSFGDFIKELNKAIKATNRLRVKESLEPVSELTKKDKFEWMELFEENKKKIQGLETEIAQTDKEIDQMVYELYELTEDDIAIVEGSK